MARMLTKDPSKRITALEILQHPWLSNVDMMIDIFDEQERLLIRKEFTYHLVKKNKLKPGREQTDLNT